MTGPYRATRLDQDQEMTLEAIAKHWAGPSPIRKITAKLVVDPTPGLAQGLGPDSRR